jgi:predicted transcriptional regulator of viral defense system
MKYQEIETTLRNQGVTLFTSREFRRAAGLTPASAKFLLIRYVKKGLLSRLKARRGLYCFSQRPPHPWVLANALVRPSYVSLESVMARDGLIPESLYGVTSVTPGVTRVFRSLGLTFDYHAVKHTVFGGAAPVDVGGDVALAAGPEKALADYLYLVFLSKKPLNDRIRWERVRKRHVIRCLKLYKTKRLVEWAGRVIPGRA